MFMFEMVSEFRVRIAVVGCCGTGRNFLFAGYLDGDGVNELIISDGAGVGGAHTLVYSQACSCFEPTTDSSAGTFTGTAGLGITSMSFADYDGDESSIPARTSCRLQPGFNGLSPHPTNVLNAGQLFYANGYPNSSSSNIGYETDDAVSTYFLVTDHEAGSTSPSGAYFVFQVSKAGTSSGGNLNADFSFPAYPSSMNYPELVLLDDPGEGALNVWDRETGTGQFTWSWTGCCTGGMVLGPFPPMGFTMKIELGARGNSSDPRVFGGTTSVRVGSYSSLNNDVDFMTMPARPMEITVTGQTCNDYCAIASSCGECTIRSAGDTQCGWCSATGTCMPAARAAVVCPDHPTIGDAFIEYRTCCPVCEALFGLPDACTETAGCGYCAETGECISGSSELACRLCTAAPPFNISALVNDDPNATCVPPDAFVQLHMHNARIVRSNLGGQGGLCSRNASDCDEAYNNVTTPHNILIRNIGLNVMSAYHQPAGAISGGEVVDLLISNLTTYRSWAPYENGLVVKNGVNEFAQINLLAPRRAEQTNSWNTEMTFVELKFEFVTMNSTTGALRPLPLGRIFLTFHDFYTGRIRQGVISNTEIIQIDPVAAHPTELYADDTELERLDNWSQAVTDSQLQSFFPSNASRSYLNSWARKVTRSSTAGVAADDPLDSYTLTTQQANRAIMFMFEMVSEFRVRIAVVGCCGTGRSFIFAGSIVNQGVMVDGIWIDFD
ncbi:fibrillin 1 [Chrysochromulina tobinii]|uniref:Fibrillin 1 n=1 Tax=Chrysochromulina tobinii TaxID=1460289 RepID=A0A0M0K6M7_9EUKA|nr:fibrillin 1 [Chrysochromulina tobinii]|eukprot:KOO34521.1 fibrillin 1 [Chrysochromulina sp. CCMP291]